MIALLLAGAVAGFGYGMTATAKTGEAQAAATAAVSAGSPMVPGNFSDLAEKVRTGVVNIQVSKKVKNVGFERFAGETPSETGIPSGISSDLSEGNQPERKQQGVGSGFIMSKEGYILTNNHVVEDADQIKVKLAGGKEFDGKIVGRDPKTDLALVKIDGAFGPSTPQTGQFGRLEGGQLGGGRRKSLRTGTDGDRRNRQRQGQGDRLRPL